MAETRESVIRDCVGKYLLKARERADRPFLADLGGEAVNMVPPEPLSDDQLNAVAQLGFEKGHPNFQRRFPPDSSSSDIAQVIAASLANVFARRDEE